MTAATIPAPVTTGHDDTGRALNVLGLFSGIGGLELGLERAGMTTVGQVELDPYCRRVLAKHWPDVPRHDDVRTAADWWLSTERPGVDVICGGFPCQDISVAGKRAGIIDGEQSSRWTYLAHTVRVLRPRYVLMENVARILVSGLDVVAADLAEIGYDLRWDCVPAQALGANHRRDRWFGIAYPNGEHLRVEPIRELGSGSASVVDADGTAGHLADAPRVRRRPGWPGRSAGDGAYWARIWPQALADPNGEPMVGAAIARDERHSWESEPDVGRVVDGFPSELDRDRHRARIHALGNAVVPQVAEYVGRLIVDHAERAA